MAQCKHIKNDGSPCRAPARDSGFCYFHDPELEELRRDAWSRGGKSNRHVLISEAQKMQLKTLQDVYNLLAEMLESLASEFFASDSTPTRIKIANTSAILGQALLRIKANFDLEQRISELEKIIGLGYGQLKETN